MKNLNIEQFNPKKADIIALTEKFKDLEIQGIDDKQGYQAVHQARIELKNSRVAISKQGKNLRDGAIKFQREVIKVEKELVALIEPTETSLANKQKLIDEEKEQQKRIQLIPERREKLKEIDYKIDDIFLITMDNIQFQEFFNQQKEDYLFKQAEKIRIEQEKIDAEKLKIKQQQQNEKIRVQAQKEAQEQAIKDIEIAKLKAEEDKRQAIENEKRKAEEEKQQLIDKQERKEKERTMLEEKAKREADDKLKLEKEAQEKLEKQKKYQKFLQDNGYTEKNKDEFYIQRIDNKILLFKKINEIIIN